MLFFFFLLLINQNSSYLCILNQPKASLDIYQHLYNFQFVQFMKQLFSQMKRPLTLATFACGALSGLAQTSTTFRLNFDDEGDSLKRAFFDSSHDGTAPPSSRGIEVSLNRDFTDAQQIYTDRWARGGYVQFSLKRKEEQTFPLTVYIRSQRPNLYIECDSVTFESSLEAMRGKSVALLKGYKPLFIDYSIGSKGDTIPTLVNYFQHKNPIPAAKPIRSKHWYGDETMHLHYDPLLIFAKPGDKIEFDMLPINGVYMNTIYGKWIKDAGFQEYSARVVYEDACLPYHTVHTMSDSEKADTLRLDYRQAKKVQLFIKDDQGNYVKTGGHSKLELKNGLAFNCDGMDFYLTKHRTETLLYNDSLYADTIGYGGFIVGAKEVPGIGTDPALTGCEVYAFPGKYTLHANPKCLNTDNMVPFSIEVKDNDEQVQSCILDATTTYPFNVRVKDGAKKNLSIQALASSADETGNLEEQSDMLKNYASVNFASKWLQVDSLFDGTADGDDRVFHFRVRKGMPNQVFKVRSRDAYNVMTPVVQVETGLAAGSQVNIETPTLATIHFIAPKTVFGKTYGLTVKGKYFNPYPHHRWSPNDKEWYAQYLQYLQGDGLASDTVTFIAEAGPLTWNLATYKDPNDKETQSTVLFPEDHVYDVKADTEKQDLLFTNYYITSLKAQADKVWGFELEDEWKLDTLTTLMDADSTMTYRYLSLYPQAGEDTIQIVPDNKIRTYFTPAVQRVMLDGQVKQVTFDLNDYKFVEIKLQEKERMGTCCYSFDGEMPLKLNEGFREQTTGNYGIYAFKHIHLVPFISNTSLKAEYPLPLWITNDTLIVTQTPNVALVSFQYNGSPLSNFLDRTYDGEYSNLKALYPESDLKEIGLYYNFNLRRLGQINLLPGYYKADYNEEDSVTVYFEVTEADTAITIDFANPPAPPTDINQVEAQPDATIRPVAYYDLSGRRLNGLRKGFVLIRYEDGKVKKVLVK